MFLNLAIQMHLPQNPGKRLAPRGTSLPQVRPINAVLEPRPTLFEAASCLHSIVLDCSTKAAVIGTGPIAAIDLHRAPALQALGQDLRHGHHLLRDRLQQLRDCAITLRPAELHLLLP